MTRSIVTSGAQKLTMGTENEQKDLMV